MGKSLADVYDDIRGDKAFDHLRTPGVVLVPGEGPSRPNILIVGEAPGATENTARRPFVGASGKVLRSLITDVAKLPAEDYFITNTVKYRPPGNRTPSPVEILKSATYLRQEWSVLGRPKILVAVGGVALAALAPHLPSITRSAGNLYLLRGGNAIWPMLHPKDGLRNKSVQPKMEEDWEKFGDWYRL